METPQQQQQQQPQQSQGPREIFVELRCGVKSRLTSFRPDDNIFNLLYHAAASTFNFSYPELFFKFDTSSYLILCNNDISILNRAGILQGDRWVFEVREAAPRQQPQEPAVVWKSPQRPGGEFAPMPRFALAHLPLSPAQTQQLMQSGVTGPAGQKFNFSGLPEDFLQELGSAVSQFILVKK